MSALDRLALTIVLGTRHVPFVQGSKGLVNLLLEAHAAIIQLLPAYHLCLLELIGLLVEVLPLFPAPPLLIGLPFLLVTRLLHTLPVSPILLHLIIQGPEIALQLVHLSLVPALDCLTFGLEPSSEPLACQLLKGFVQLFLKLNSALFQLLPACHLSLLEFVG